MINEDIVKELAEKFEKIKLLVMEYNRLSSDNKIDSEVGCIINNNNDAEMDMYSCDHEGWLPSSTFC